MPQLTPSGLIAGSMVLMADGSERPIEHVQTGMMVVCPSGAHQRVSRTYQQDHTGDLVSISTALNRRSVTATPVQRFSMYRNGNSGSQFVDGTETPEWMAVEDLAVGNRLLLCAPAELAVSALSVARKSGFVGSVYSLQIASECAFICNGYAVHSRPTETKPH